MNKPRKAPAKYLIGAPAALLAVYDNGGRTADRYTALYGAPIWTPDYGYTLPGRGMSSDPSHPQGVGTCCEVDRNVRGRALGKLVAFASLPEGVRRCIELDCWLAE